MASAAAEEEGDVQKSASAPTSNLVNIGSRKSRLAVIQTELVHKALREAWPDLEIELHTMRTAGDKDKVTPLHSFNAKSLWTEELEALLLDGRLDLIVHSLKDIPTQLPPSLRIGAIFPREDPRDALVMKPSLPYTSLFSLPPGSIVGTSSVRRTAQISRRYPHLRFENVRGNIDTRLAKLDAADGRYACLVLAAAGLKRLDLGHRITHFLDSRMKERNEGAGEGGGVAVQGTGTGVDREIGWLHAVGQGALAVEIRQGDHRIENLLKDLACKKTTLACLSERSLMRTLEGGCSVPIGVETEWADDDHSSSFSSSSPPPLLTMRASVTSTDGASFVESCQSVRMTTEVEADEFGRTVAKELIDKGAGPILQQILLNRDIVDA
ncbi:MAG: porphobilinogen deaminase [Sclerophora amabilis]|nr:MAG: porphobilinogen deaminase [Sclerophora amabilis]